MAWPNFAGSPLRSTTTVRRLRGGVLAVKDFGGVIGYGISGGF